MIPVGAQRYRKQVFDFGIEAQASLMEVASPNGNISLAYPFFARESSGAQTLVK